MKKMRWLKTSLLLTAVLFMSAAVFIGCKMNDDDDDDDSNTLSVSLSATTESGTSSSSFYSDQPFYVTATVSNASGTPSYSWYIDNERQTASTYKVTCQIRTSTSQSHTIKVSVTDNSETKTNSVSVYITAAGSMLVTNYSGYSILFLYNKLSSASSWSSDWLGSGTIPNDNSAIVYGVPSGYYDWKALRSSSSSSFYTYEYTNVPFSLGIRRVWKLYATNQSLTNKTGTVTDSDMPEETDVTSCAVDSDASILHSIPFSDFIK